MSVVKELFAKLIMPLLTFCLFDNKNLIIIL